MAAPSDSSSFSHAESDAEESSNDSSFHPAKLDLGNSAVVKVKTRKTTAGSGKGSGRENHLRKQPSAFPSPAIVQK